jgi:hypothetical protein
MKYLLINKIGKGHMYYNMQRAKDTCVSHRYIWTKDKYKKKLRAPHTVEKVPYFSIQAMLLRFMSKDL